MAIRWRGRTVGALFSERAREMGDTPFLLLPDGETLSYGALWRRGLRVAALLQKRGVRAGAPVAVMLPNGAEAVCAMLGACLLGGVDVSINTAYVGATFDHALRQVGARHLIVAAEYLSALDPESDAVRALEAIFVVDGPDGAEGGASSLFAGLRTAGLPLLDFAEECRKGAASPTDLPEVRPQDTACVIYTSGSTGPAKAVMMPHAQVMLIAAQTVRHMGLGPGDIVYSVHPLYHMAGKFMLLLACADAGARIVLDRGLRPELWLERIRETGATFTGAHGAMLEMIAAQPPTPHDRDHRLRTICAAPFPKHLAAGFEQRFGVRGVEVWGMTEVGIPVWCDAQAPLEAGCCGQVDRAFFEFAIVDPATDEPVPLGDSGEFVVRNRYPWTMMQGYAGQPEATAAAWRNLWFHTGDTGYMDEEGRIFFLDRAGDRIRRRAENIASHDVEAAALDHPSVREAVAVGYPSEFSGDDDIRLFVVPAPGGAFEPLTLLRHMTARLPHFMVPRYIEAADSLPRSATQKVQRGRLRARPLGPDAWDRKSHGVRLKEIKENP